MMTNGCRTVTCPYLRTISIITQRRRIRIPLYPLNPDIRILNKNQRQVSTNIKPIGIPNPFMPLTLITFRARICGRINSDVCTRSGIPPADQNPGRIRTRVVITRDVQDISVREIRRV